MAKRLLLKDEDFIGFKKNKIEVIGIGYKNESGKRMYEVQCNNCGHIYYQSLGNLLIVKGEGCKNCKNSYLKTHGMKHERIYNVWVQMKHRCNGSKDEKHYKHYGARGIKVCKEWEESFVAFRDWAYENGWSEDEIYSSGRNKLTIDRIDNDGDYCPENCRVITHHEQQYNKRTTVYVEYEGQKYTYKDLSILLGIPKTTLISRVKRGWKEDELLEQYHYKDFEKIEYNGKKYSYTELAEISRLPRKIIYQRIHKNGWSVKDAVEIPLNGFNPNINLYEYEGEMLCIAEIARRCGLNRTTLQYRLAHGWDIEKATKTNLMRKAENK